VTYAVDSPRWQARIALAADHLIAVVLGGKGLERRLDDTATETEDQVKRRLLLDVVVGQGAAILELLAGEDQALLVRGNALLVLDLGLDVVCPWSASMLIPPYFACERSEHCTVYVEVALCRKEGAYRWCQRTPPRG
jgi:hypothetical protein